MFLIGFCVLVSFGCYKPVVTPKHLSPELVAPRIVNPGTIDLSRLSGFAASNLSIEPGDVIEVTIIAGVADQRPLSVPLRIGDDGIALVPLLGQISLAGMELKQAEQVIRQAAITRGLYRNPHVTVVMDKKRIIPSAALCEGEFGVDGYFIGVPTVIGANGIEKILEFKLLPHEQEMLNNTLKAVKKTVAETKL